MRGSDDWSGFVPSPAWYVAMNASLRAGGFVHDQDTFEFGNCYWPFDNERDYRMDRPYELLDTWAAKQREIARELSRG